MAVLTRDQIMAASDIVHENVPVPEWGGEVIVRSLMGHERDALEVSLAPTDGKGRPKDKALAFENIRAKFVAASVVDDKDQLLFYPSDIELLGKKSAAALDRVFEVVRRISRITPQDVEELAGN